MPGGLCLMFRGDLECLGGCVFHSSPLTCSPKDLLGHDGRLELQPSWTQGFR